MSACCGMAGDGGGRDNGERRPRARFRVRVRASGGERAGEEEREKLGLVVLLSSRGGQGVREPGIDTATAWAWRHRGFPVATGKKVLL